MGSDAMRLKRLSDGSSGHTLSCLDVDWKSMQAVTGHWDFKIRLWDLDTSSLLGSQPRAGGVYALVVNWHTRTILSGGGDGSLWLSHVDTAALQDMKGHSGRIACVEANWDLQRA